MKVLQYQNQKISQTEQGELNKARVLLSIDNTTRPCLVPKTFQFSEL